MARRMVRRQTANTNSEPLKKEFIQLFKVSGWTQAEVARQLELTRGGVNGIITGRTVPSHATVKLFRLILLSEKPEVMSAAARPATLQYAEESWLRELLDEMRRVAPGHRQRLISALKSVAASFPKNPRGTQRKPEKRR